jgi:hypothetical protein
MAKALAIVKTPVMSSSKKVVPLTKTIDATNGIQAIGTEFEDLFAELRDARTVVNVATEAWGEENENSASSCVGVLDLLDYKLKEVEREAQSIMKRAKVQNARRA